MCMTPETDVHSYGYESGRNTAGAGFGLWQAEKEQQSRKQSVCEKQCTGRGHIPCDPPIPWLTPA